MDTHDQERRAMIAARVPEERLFEAQGLDPDSVLDTEALREQFEVLAFLAPLVRVRRRSDGAPGWMMFTHHPRYYFDFRTEQELRP